MSTNLDRFSQGVTPKEPDEVGCCAACSGTMYDYDLIECDICGSRIHQSCIEVCDGCGRVGCKCNVCLVEIDGLLYCEECKPKPEREQPLTLVQAVMALTEKPS